MAHLACSKFLLLALLRAPRGTAEKTAGNFHQPSLPLAPIPPLSPLFYIFPLNTPHPPPSGRPPPVPPALPLPASFILTSVPRTNLPGISIITSPGLIPSQLAPVRSQELLGINATRMLFPRTCGVSEQEP